MHKVLIVVIIKRIKLREDLDPSSPIQSPWSLKSPAKTGPAIWKGIKVKKQIDKPLIRSLAYFHRASKMKRKAVREGKALLNVILRCFKTCFILDFGKTQKVDTLPSQKSFVCCCFSSCVFKHRKIYFTVKVFHLVFWSLENIYYCLPG